ncbi:MAG: hypothetical protein KY397_06845 [Gemmatimonadetes bacterium]|nr:hypothetical protein [Gemmatimonadota bacterium]
MVRRFVWLVALSAAVYIGWNYGTPHFRAWRFRDAMNQRARLSETAERDEIKRELLGDAEELGIPLDPRRLTVRRIPRGPIAIGASWREIVTIEGGPLGTWIDTLRFEYEVSSTTEGR